LALAACAQQATMPVIGLFDSASPDWYADRLRTFREGLGETGYVEARKLRNCLTFTLASSNRRSPGPRTIPWTAGPDPCAPRRADTFFVGRRDQLVALADRYWIPTSYFRREFIEAGDLISYAATVVEAFCRTGVYVGRVKGEKPRDLPVEQPTKYELVINLKTAKTLGLEVPSSLLARADGVIE
jgi:hypothetical protein